MCPERRTGAVLQGCDASLHLLGEPQEVWATGDFAVPPHLHRSGTDAASFVKHARECLRRRDGLRPLSTSGGSLCSTGRRLLVSVNAVRGVYGGRPVLATRFTRRVVAGPPKALLVLGGGHQLAAARVGP